MIDEIAPFAAVAVCALLVCLTVYGLSKQGMTSKERAHYDSQSARREAYWQSVLPVGGGGTCVEEPRPTTCDCHRHLKGQHFSACESPPSQREPIVVQARIPVWSVKDEWHRDCLNFAYDLDEFAAKWRGRVPR